MAATIYFYFCTNAFRPSRNMMPENVGIGAQIKLILLNRKWHCMFNV